MQKKTNTTAVVLGITAGVFAIAGVYYFMGHRKLVKAIENAGMKIDENGELVKA